MDDFTYDIVQKKRIAAGARHKKNGSKSKWCHLPSDNLTAQQLKERNGPVMNYAMNRPMDWETFKSMPLDLQQTYLDSLNSRFSVSAGMIGVDVFGLSRAGLYPYLRKYGLKIGESKRLTNAELELWNNWLHGEPKIAKEPVEEEEPDEVEEEIPEEEEKPTEPFFSPGGIGHHLFPFMPLPNKYDTVKEIRKEEEPLGLDHLSATFKGTFTPETFLKWISKLPMPDGNVCIRVEVDRR